MLRFSVAVVSDSDGDGMPNDYELANGFNPNDPSDGGLDADADGFTNAEEFNAGTNPRNYDTDGDGIGDGLESSRSTVLKRLIARDSVLRAAQSMWSGAPHGVVEVIGGDSRFEGKASLAGFRELWRWGVEHCGLPRVDASD